MGNGTTQIRGWYNANASSEFPLVNGSNAHRAILADISVATTTTGLHISSLAVDNDYVSVVLSDDAGIFGAVSGYLTPGESYVIVSDRGTGVVVFGPYGVVGSYRSTEPLYIQPRCVQLTYATLPVIHRIGLLPTDSPLKLTSGEDILVRFGYIDPAGTLPALFIGLNVTTDDRETIHEKYLGPCDKRPEMGNCGDPVPVRSLGGVTADCCNTIYVELQGVKITPLTNYCGVAVGIDYGLADACPPRKLSKVVNIEIDDCSRPADYTGAATTKAEGDAADAAVANGSLVSGDGTLVVPPAAALPVSDSGGEYADRPSVDVFGNVNEYDTNKITTAWVYRFGKEEPTQGKDDDAEGDIPTTTVTDK